jgi:hypothetical protein
MRLRVGTLRAGGEEGGMLRVTSAATVPFSLGTWLAFGRRMMIPGPRSRKLVATPGADADCLFTHTLSRRCRLAMKVEAGEQALLEPVERGKRTSHGRHGSE